MRQGIWQLALILFVAAGAVAYAQERVLRVDEVAPGRLDPALSTDYADSMLMFNLYDALVFPDPVEGVRPHLAESWQISEDGTEFVFELRQGVLFSDGSEVTAADVVFSMERMLAIGRGFAHLYEGWVESVQADGDYTVRFTLSRPYAPFLASLVRLGIVNRDAVLDNLEDGDFEDMGDYGQAFLGSQSAGSGAYVAVSHSPEERTVMRRNDDYFLGFADNAPDEVRMSYSLEPATVRTLMARSEHEITSQWLPPEILGALAGTEGVELLEEPGQSVFFMMLNTQLAPTDDLEFRRAMALAFDYEALLTLLEVTEDVAAGTHARGPLPEGMPGFNEELPVPRQDMEAARAALAASQYADGGVTVEIGWVTEVPIEESIALILQQNLIELGIDADVVGVPWALMTDRASSPETTPNVSLIYVSATHPDPDAMLYHMYHSAASGTWLAMSWLQDPEVDALLEDARTTIDLEQRMALYQKLQELLNELQPDIFGYEQVAVFGKQDYVTVPTLEDPEQTIAVQGANWIFRLIELNP